MYRSAGLSWDDGIYILRRLVFVFTCLFLVLNLWELNFSHVKLSFVPKNMYGWYHVRGNDRGYSRLCVFQYTLYSALSVFSMAKSVQLILEISAGRLQISQLSASTLVTNL